MSITTELQRLRTNVNNIRQNTSDILDAIANKGVEIPAGSTLDDCAGLIDSIPSGGGESWRDWYDELPRLGYKISTVEFNNSSLMAKLNIDCHIESKHTHILGSSASTPNIIYVYSNQGSNDWTPTIEIDKFTTGPNKIWIEFNQPWNGYQRIDDPFTWFEGQTQEYIGRWNKYGLSLSVNGTGHSVTLGANVSSSWYAKLIQPIRNGFGDSQMYFYYTKVYDEDDELIMNFIPAKRKVDGVLGVLETITGLFAGGSNLSEG